MKKCFDTNWKNQFMEFGKWIRQLCAGHTKDVQAVSLSVMNQIISKQCANWVTLSTPTFRAPNALVCSPWPWVFDWLLFYNWASLPRATESQSGPQGNIFCPPPPHPLWFLSWLGYVKGKGGGPSPPVASSPPLPTLGEWGCPTEWASKLLWSTVLGCSAVELSQASGEQGGSPTLWPQVGGPDHTCPSILPSPYPQLVKQPWPGPTPDHGLRYFAK